MNAYQQYVLAKMKFEFISTDSQQSSIVSLKEGTLELKQEEDYTHMNYILRISGYKISSVLLNQGRVETNGGEYLIHLSFKEPIEKFVLNFEDNMVDDITINLNMIPADKSIWDAKMASANQMELESKLSLYCRTGVNLVNIHWANVSDDVKSTTIKVYAKKEDGTILPILSTDIPNSEFFLPIPNLAFGSYSVSIGQLSKKGFLLITKMQDFEIVNLFTLLEQSISKQLQGVKSQVQQSGKKTVRIT